MVDPAKETTALKVICLMYIVSKETKSIQDSEADTLSSGRNPKSVDIQTLIHRNEPNRPHISSVTKFSKSVETKSTGSANLPSATRLSYLRIPLTSLELQTGSFGGRSGVEPRDFTPNFPIRLRALYAQ